MTMRLVNTEAADNFADLSGWARPRASFSVGVWRNPMRFEKSNLAQPIPNRGPAAPRLLTPGKMLQ